MARADRRGVRRGVALPLALFALLAVALLVALVLDAAVQELRSSRGELGGLQAAAAVETALADALAAARDSALWAARPIGAMVLERRLAGGDTVDVASERLADSWYRMVVSARIGVAGDRASAGAIAFVQLVRTPPDSAFRLAPIPGAWWSPGR
jgi:hypothetical protein